jgi:hypothetical protein
MSDQILPIKIVRKRNKTYTQKRQPYKTYLQADWNWSDIFKEIEVTKLNSSTYLKDISNKYGIKYSTLSKKYSNYAKSDKLDTSFDHEKRGGCNKMFSNEDEKALYDRIINGFIINNSPLNNSIIKNLALKLYSEKDKNIINGKKFTASNGWCNMFKKKWKLSTQKVKPSKKATNMPNKDDILKFLSDYKLKTSNVKKKIYTILMK